MRATLRRKDRARRRLRASCTHTLHPSPLVDRAMVSLSCCPLTSLAPRVARAVGREQKPGGWGADSLSPLLAARSLPVLSKPGHRAAATIPAGPSASLFLKEPEVSFHRPGSPPSWPFNLCFLLCFLHGRLVPGPVPGTWDRGDAQQLFVSLLAWAGP